VDNPQVALKLTEHAAFLEAREASLYRVRAYRRAAETVLGLDRPLTAILADEGRPGLEALPGIGRHLSFTIEQLILTGEFRTLSRDREQIDAKHLLQCIVS